MKTIQAEKKLTDAEIEALAGLQLGDDAYDLVLREDADVLKPDGSFLLRFRKKQIPLQLAHQGWRNLRKAAVHSDNRGIAAGIFAAGEITAPVGTRSKTRYQQMKRDGTLSNTNRAKTVRSGIVGFFDRNPRIPFCRQTAFNIQHGDKFAAAIPFIQAVDAGFAQHMPERYAAQAEYAARTSPDFMIPNTVFTTITVNKNWQTAVHQDAGDLRAGFGVMCAMRAGEFDGCYLVFPQYRVAVDMDNGDLLLADVHEWHGNSPIRPRRASFERISTVFYYREKMARCGSALQEAEIAKSRQRLGIIEEADEDA